MHLTPTAALNKLSLLLILIIKKINNESFINDRLESMRILPKEKKKETSNKILQYTAENSSHAANDLKY